jgi:hypothetical protein
MGRRNRADPRFAWVLAALVPLFAACSSAPLEQGGTQCASDSECTAGLHCLAVVGTASDGGCSSLTACSRACAIDSDCVLLGASFKCSTACDGSRACVETE